MSGLKRRHVRGLEMLGERGVRLPAFKHPDGTRVVETLGKGIGMATVLCVGGGDHGADRIGHFVDVGR